MVTTQGEIQRAFTALQQRAPAGEDAEIAAIIIPIAQGLCINIARIAEALEKLANNG